MPANARVVVVVGAAGDVGRATAQRFSLAGWHVVALSRAEQSEFEHYRVDLADAKHVHAASDSVFSQHSNVACVVNAAGQYRMTGEEASDPAVIQNNLGIAQNIFRAFAPGMAELEGARIITIGSIDGYYVNPNSFSYSVAKAAVASLTALHRKKYKGTKLNFDLIAPGAIHGRMRAAKSEDKSALLQPEDIAELCFSLANFGSHVSFDDIVIYPKSFSYTK